MFKSINFNPEERKDIALTVIVLAFILSFSEWGVDKFDLQLGLSNFVLALIITGISLIGKLSVQKYFSRKAGFDAVFKTWMIGLAFGFMMIFLTNGALIFLSVGGLSFAVIEKLRIGKHEPNLSYTQLGWLCLLGPLFSILLALIAKILIPAQILSESILMKVISTNLWIAVFSIIPIPYLHKFKPGGVKEFTTSDGLKLLYASPLQYLLVLVLVIFSGLTILASPLIIALIVTIVSFVLIWIVYAFIYKNNIKSQTQHRIYKYKFE